MATGDLKSLDIVVTTDRNLVRLYTLDKQFTFAAARTLTRLADTGRNLAILKLKRTFEIRGPWYKKERRYGIKISIAKPNNLESTVWTGADWLESHETDGGASKKLSGKAGSAGFVPKHFAIPSDMSNQRTTLVHVAPKRTQAGGVSRQGKPGRLRAGKRRPAFILRAKSGIRLLLQRLQKGAEPVLRYVMPDKVDIKENKTITPSVQFAVTVKGQEIFEEELANAIRTARTTSLALKS